MRLDQGASYSCIKEYTSGTLVYHTGISRQRRMRIRRRWSTSRSRKVLPCAPYTRTRVRAALLLLCLLLLQLLILMCSSMDCVYVVGEWCTISSTNYLSKATTTTDVLQHGLCVCCWLREESTLQSHTLILLLQLLYSCAKGRKALYNLTP